MPMLSTKITTQPKVKFFFMNLLFHLISSFFLLTQVTCFIRNVERAWLFLMTGGGFRTSVEQPCEEYRKKIKIMHTIFHNILLEYLSKRK